MDGKVGAPTLLFGRQAQPHGRFEDPINGYANDKGKNHAAESSDQLGHEADPAEAAERGQAKDTGCNPAPCTAEAMKRPDAQDIIDLEPISGIAESRERR